MGPSHGLTTRNRGNTGKEQPMGTTRQTIEYYWTRFAASREQDAARGEVSATTVVLAAALIALALAVGATITSKVRDKANNLDLG